MKPRTLSLLVLVGLLWGASALADTPAPPQTLTLQDLVNRPDHWPPTVTVQRDFIFNNGVAVHTGDAARIIHFDGARLLLIAGKNIRFQVKPEDCDLLNAANQAWSALTPACNAPSIPHPWPPILRSGR